MFRDVPECSGMFRNVPECSGMFHVPDFIDGPVKPHGRHMVNLYKRWLCDENLKTLSSRPILCKNYFLSIVPFIIYYYYLVN